ncbi:MAG TPA: aldehyde dehydrogenase family protein, partial [Flavobacteriales bacterium]|nr:aldehyde dehydrogenase family protein [Flavobacteriales bacterium]
MITEEIEETNGVTIETEAPDGMMKEIVQKQRDYFNTGATKEVNFRIRALKKLKEALQVHESNLLKALHDDLGKSEQEGYATEIGVTIAEIEYYLSHIRAWARPERVPTPLFFMPGKSRVHKEPFGTVLIIAPWNFPIKNLLGPALGAIAAGNTCVLKPSELSPHTSAALKVLFD